MRMTLKDVSRVPYGGGYNLHIPELGIVGRGNSYHQLRDNVAAYRKANAIPIGLGFDDELTQAVCAQYPNECNIETPPGAPTPSKSQKIGWQDVVAGTQVMAKHLAQGSPLVSNQEAANRALICVKCPWKSEVALPCGNLCGELETLVRSILGTSFSVQFPNLANKCCKVCHCFLQASVWLPLDIQQSVLSQDHRNQFKAIATQFPCWKAVGL